MHCQPSNLHKNQSIKDFLSGYLDKTSLAVIKIKNLPIKQPSLKLLRLNFGYNKIQLLLMNQIIISINPLAEFLVATEKRKIKIIEEQLNPDPVRIPYYQKARVSIKNCIIAKGNLSSIDEGIEFLKEKVPEKDWQKHDKKNSIIALELWKQMNLPTSLLENDFEIIRTKVKFLPILGIHIRVSPNLIFRTKIEGQIYIGAIKIHISKGKPFSIKQSAFVAQLMNLFLSRFVVQENEIVNPQLCICIDPFSGTMVSASNKIKVDAKELKAICKEIPGIWDELNNNNQEEASVA